MPFRADATASPRMAAIDVGTNTIRCIVVQVTANGGFRILDDEKATVRLGEGLAASGEIGGEAWQRAREALLRMRKIIDGFGVQVVAAVATSAVRRAANGAAFTRAMERDTGVAIRTIDGEEEADLAVRSARHHFDTQDARYALVDIGGGSAEVITAFGEHVEQVVSLDLGAVYLSERFVTEDPIAEGSFRGLRRHIRKSLRQALEATTFAPQYLIGSGGTVTTLGSMVMALRGESYDGVHGYEVLRSEVVHVLAMLQRSTRKERRGIAGLSPERVDIILAGVTVVDRLMRHFAINLLKINDRGIREGLVLQSLHDHGLLPAAPGPRDWRSCVRDFARTCHVDEVHAGQVTWLCLQLFDAVAAHGVLSPRCRDLLEAAAWLHDVGYFIAYAKHHKHSYHLIRHANLFDFSPREREIVASVARYHRGAAPKRKHDHFAQLAPEDQVLVRKLAGILRLADGLDRRRNRQVGRLRCELRDRVCQLHIGGEGDLSVELHGGRTRGDVFAAAFDLELVLSADPDVPPVAAGAP